MKCKGMSMALTLVVGAVVLIVVALTVITITTGGLTNFFGGQAEQQQQSQEETKKTVDSATCNLKKITICGDGCYTDSELADWTEKCEDISVLQEKCSSCTTEEEVSEEEVV